MDFKKLFEEFWLPIISLVVAIVFIFIARSFTDGWVGLGYIIMALVLFGVSVLSLIVVFLKRFFKWDIKWWWYIIIIPALFAITIFIIKYVNR